MSANVYAADQLFATLDPTLRLIDVVDVGDIVLADTVGFIRHFPHDLVAAFKATLQGDAPGFFAVTCDRRCRYPGGSEH